MSGKIIVTPDLLKQRAQQCEKFAEDVLKIHEDLKKLAKNLEEEWEGDASKNFLNEFREVVLPNFEKASSLLNAKKTGASAQLMEKANKFNEADK